MIKPKPDNVKIISHAIAVAPGTFTGVPSMVITGLGDDELIYKYDAKAKTWSIEVEDE